MTDLVNPAFSIWLVGLLAMFAGVGDIRAQTRQIPQQPAVSPAVLERLKEATAYLELSDGTGSGSAFCISAEGYFVTCSHVVEGRKEGAVVDLVLNPGLPRERKVTAKIEKLEPDHDLAILKTEPLAISTLSLAQPFNLKETDAVIIAGYPFGRAMGKNGKAPAVSVTLGRVTAIRKTDAKVDLVQLDAFLNPGNSGGPVVDNQGRVVGVVSTKIVGTQSNLAIGSQSITGALLLPRIQVGPVPKLRISEPLEIPFELSFLKPPQSPPRVTAVFETGTGELLPMEVVPKDATHYRLRKSFARDASVLSGISLRIEGVREVGTSRFVDAGLFKDRMIKVGASEVRLSDCVMLFPAEGRSTQADGTTLRGKIEGLRELVTLDGNLQVMDFSSYPTIVVRAESKGLQSVSCRINVGSGDFTKSLRVPIEVEPGSSGSILPSNPRIEAFRYERGLKPSFAGESIDLPLGGEAAEMAWGGGGRYLVVRLRGVPKLVVIDCLEGRKVGELPLPSDNPQFTADGSDLFVSSGDRLERWRLKDLEKQGGPMVIPGSRIIKVAAGSTWTREVVVLWHLMGNPNLARLELRDSNSGKVLALEQMEDFGAKGIEDVDVSAHARILRVTFNNGTRTTFRLVGNQLTSDGRFGGGEGDWLDAGGNWFLNRDGRYSSIKKIAWVGDMDLGFIAPTTVSNLAVRLWNGGRRDDGTSGSNPRTLEVIDLGREECLVRGVLSVTDVGVPTRYQSGKDGGLVDPTFNLVPQLGFFASLSWDRSIVKVRKFDLWAELKNAKQPYLILSGVIPDMVPAEVPFVCDMGVESSGKKTRATIVSGPEGLIVDDSGVLHWPSPKANQGGEVVVRISADDGGELLWRQAIRVR